MSSPEAQSPPPPLALDDLQRLPLDGLISRAAGIELRVRPDSTRHHLILDQARHQLHRGGILTGKGLLEKSGDTGMIRWTAFDLRPGPEDIFVPAAIVRQYGLGPGLMLEFTIRLPRDRERGLVVGALQAIEGIPVSEWKPPVDFEKLTPLFRTGGFSSRRRSTRKWRPGRLILWPRWAWDNGGSLRPLRASGKPSFSRHSPDQSGQITPRPH